jgi:ribulose-bisphosphate carboxylase large chain
MSEERFQVIYHIVGTEAAALEQAQIICLEQTVEVGQELVPAGFIREQIVGRLEQFAPVTSNCYAATISYAIETAAEEVTQLLNVIFGNTSIKPGIRVQRLILGEKLLAAFGGPRFGIAGLRQLIGVPEKPLLCAVLKPMGKPVAELATLAYQFALGGVDIIKDDHGLTNQPFCPFNERVQACSEAVHRANQQTGKHCLYAPNITAPYHQLRERAIYARATGAGALLIAPGLTGFDSLRALAADEAIKLPLLSHPALLGTMVTHPSNGLTHGVVFGQLQRLVGADATIYPNYGGRFGFTREECQDIATSCQEPLGNYPPIFPMPGGGMGLARLPELLNEYGNEVILLVGGALYTHSPDIVANGHYILSLVGRS